MATDLDSEKAPNDGAPIFKFKPNVAPSDIQTRQIVSYLLLALLAAVVIVAFVILFQVNWSKPVPDPKTLALFNNEQAADAVADDDRLMRLMNLVFGPLVTLFSSVVGFYFGAKTANETPSGGGVP